MWENVQVDCFYGSRCTAARVSTHSHDALLTLKMTLHVQKMLLEQNVTRVLPFGVWLVLLVRLPSINSATVQCIRRSFALLAPFPITSSPACVCIKKKGSGLVVPFHTVSQISSTNTHLVFLMRAVIV